MPVEQMRFSAFARLHGCHRGDVLDQDRTNCPGPRLPEGPPLNGNTSSGFNLRAALSAVCRQERAKISIIFTVILFYFVLFFLYICLKLIKGHIYIF